MSTTAGGRSLKTATSHPIAKRGGPRDLDAGAIWCRAPEKGGPSSEGCAREGNAGLSIKGHGQGLSNLMSYCLENQNNMPNETALVQWGLKNPH